MDKGEFYEVRVNGHLVGLSIDIDEALKMYHAVKETVDFLKSDAIVVLLDTDDTVLTIKEGLDITGQKGMYEIRIYNKIYNMDRNYYEGDEDIRTMVICRSIEKLIESWKMLLEENEGETYSVWDGPDILVGGAYDPGDLDIILEKLGMVEKEDRNEV